MFTTDPRLADIDAARAAGLVLHTTRSVWQHPDYPGLDWADAKHAVHDVKRLRRADAIMAAPWGSISAEEAEENELDRRGAYFGG